MDQLRKDDEEGAELLKFGPMCVIYDCGLFDDEEAMLAICREDNKNAAVEWGEDEMQAFGRMCMTVDGFVGAKTKHDMTSVMHNIEAPHPMAEYGYFMDSCIETYVVVALQQPPA